MKIRPALIFYLLTLIACTPSSPVEVDLVQPEEYGELFYDVQTNEHIFSDSKTFVDAVPLFSIGNITKDYSLLENPSDAKLKAFVENHFRVPNSQKIYHPDSATISDHITKLWQVLKQPADESLSGTLIPLPHPYIIPGGRFREIYYWDSYFTMLGLQVDGEVESIQNMVDNFSFLLSKYGFIPNGNRTYYLSRSQPPFFSMMVALLAEIKGDTIFTHYLNDLKTEYAFWMDGADQLNSTHPTHRRVVLMPDGEVLNRYWDDQQTPRPESYREDVKTAEETILRFPHKTPEGVYRDLRAAAESGWDFSSRWLLPDSIGKFDLHTIHTTELIPVDLNTLLYNLEKTLVYAYHLKGDTLNASAMANQLELRKSALLKYCWNRDKNYFMDYDFILNQSTEILSLAGTYPLFFNIANPNQAKGVLQTLTNQFIRDGGVVTTLNPTGQQWDAPNGWPPLQWITILGLRNYHYDSIASEIKSRWIRLNNRVYNNTFKMMEKYNVEDLTRISGGGEYPTQDGFGWTNGVYQKLLKEDLRDLN